MGRRKRNQTESLCYHLTHRCHNRDFLLKFKRDRQGYLMRLHQMSRRYPVDVLTYMVTSNHVHLLLRSGSAEAVSAAMHFLQGTVAGDYNRRKGREGAFWRGRYHPTLVESGPHLSRCLFYIDTNMMRAGACVHPSEWVGGAHAEILKGRQRYRIVNRDCLKWCLGMDAHSDESFIRWYEATIDEEVRSGSCARRPFWSEAVAVGGEAWVRSLLPNARNARVERACAEGVLSEDAASYAVYLPKREREAFWRDLPR